MVLHFMRQALKKNEGDRCILFGRLEGENRDGRMFFTDVLVKNINDVMIEGKCNHINVAKKHFKNKKLEKGEIIRFVGKVFKYKRQIGSSDFSVTPTDNIRRANSKEIEIYNLEFPSKNKKGYNKRRV